MHVEKSEQILKGPPSPQLQAGYLLNAEIEITGILRADDFKNVYAAQTDMDSLVILESYPAGETEIDTIPEACQPYFPENFNQFRSKDRLYASFDKQDGRLLARCRLPAWEPDLAGLAYRLCSALAAMNANEIDISGIGMADIFLADKNVFFYIFPQRAMPVTQPDEVIAAIIKNLFEFQVEPGLTRNLEKPLLALALSAEFQKNIQAFINGAIQTQTFLEQLEAFVPAEQPHWDIDAQTDVGQIRTHNEDACGWFGGFMSTYQNVHSYIALAVADGMGGHQKGEVASHFAIHRWFHWVNAELLMQPDDNFSNPKLKAFMESSFDDTARDFSDFEGFGQIPAKQRPGTTLVAALLIGRLAFIGNAGDSRAYLIDEDKIERVTSDHSLIQTYLDSGAITEQEAFTHEQSNVITSFIGIGPKQFKRSVYVCNLPKNAVLLLCSDGLTGMLTDDEIKAIVVSSENACETVQQLIMLANQKGGEDNISVALIKSAPQANLNSTSNPAPQPDQNKEESDEQPCAV